MYLRYTLRDNDGERSAVDTANAVIQRASLMGGVGINLAAATLMFINDRRLSKVTIESSEEGASITVERVNEAG